MFMKNSRIIFVLGLLVLIATGSQLVTAQENAESTQSQQEQLPDNMQVNTNDIDVTLETETQDPGSKKFQIVATISSAIDTDRVIVDWIPQNGITFSDPLDTGKSSTTVRQGSDTVVSKKFVANYSGTHEVEVVITAVKADVNYLAADNIELEFNQDLELLPLTDDYKQAKLVYQFTRGVLYLTIIVATAAALFFVYRRIRNITE